MTYTTTTWTTIAVATPGKPRKVIIYTKPDGTRGAFDADVVLTQNNESGGRRIVAGTIDMTTGEVIAAPDVPGFVELMDAFMWKHRPVTIRTVTQQSPVTPTPPISKFGDGPKVQMRYL
jgi:hypothetical protein